MPSPLGDMAPDRFLETFWQREPCFLPAAFPDFACPLDGDDLAGLACEPLAEARLVQGPDQNGRWRLQHGPFDEADFSTLGERDWTLLVQDVEKHFPPLRAVLDEFRFLPEWRLDDLMMSFAAPGGSVGPHVDQYDVFLLQAQGHRRWDIARHFDPERREDAPLDLLRRFDPEQSWELGPGDMLYLPPGVAHHGVALDACLTLSVGFRAPSAADLFLALGEALADTPSAGGRYADSTLVATRRPGEVDAAAVDRFRTLLTGAIEDATTFPDRLGRFLSQFRQAHEPAPSPDLPQDDQVLASWLSGGASLSSHPWARFNWLTLPGDAGSVMFYASGRPYRMSQGLAVWICVGAGRVPARLTKGDLATLVALIRDGQLLIDEAE